MTPEPTKTARRSDVAEVRKSPREPTQRPSSSPKRKPGLADLLVPEDEPAVIFRP